MNCPYCESEDFVEFIDPNILEACVSCDKCGSTFKKGESTVMIPAFCCPNCHSIRFSDSVVPLGVQCRDCGELICQVGKRFLDIEDER